MDIYAIAYIRTLGYIKKMMMKIADFKEFINEFPYKYQSFDIKKEIWNTNSQKDLINNIFITNNITINRESLVNSNNNLKEFVIKTLMWGYPTKGRGKNIETILKKQNFENLILKLNCYRNKEITISQIKKDIKEVEGLGLSTMSKFTHFLNTKINGNKAVILDQQIINAINKGRFVELNKLKGITYNNAINKYDEYLEVINKLTKELNVEADQIEMFLFTFGTSLSK